MKPSELLRKGAEEIRQRGWIQGWFGSEANHPETCRVCAIGGLRAALLGDPFKVPHGDPAFDEFNTARSYLIDATGIGSVVNWNDEQGRQESEVLALFERAAASAEANGR